MGPAQPPELTYQDFRRFMGWTDERVYGAQPADVVYREWTIYALRLANGDVPRTGGGGGMGFF